MELGISRFESCSGSFLCTSATGLSAESTDGSNLGKRNSHELDRIVVMGEAIMRLHKNDQDDTCGADWDSRFRKLYQNKGLMRGEMCLPIHEVCERADKCWRRNKTSYPEGETALIARPWVGASYSTSRLMAIGINLNLGGSFNQLIDETRQAINEIREGKVKVFKKLGYGGSLFHYCLGAYAGALLSKTGIIQTGSEVPPHEAFSYLAYTQHVKCSPKDEERRGRPYPEMWDQCGRHILSEEIKLLNPRLVLIIGKTDNWTHTCNLFGSLCEIRQGPTTCWVRTVKGQLLIAVRHPMAIGGSRKEDVLRELARITPGYNYTRQN